MRAVASNDKGIPCGKVGSRMCDIICYDLGADEGICRIINARGAR